MTFYSDDFTRNDKPGLGWTRDYAEQRGEQLFKERRRELCSANACRNLKYAHGYLCHDCLEQISQPPRFYLADDGQHYFLPREPFRAEQPAWRWDDETGLEMLRHDGDPRFSEDHPYSLEYLECVAESKADLERRYASRIIHSGDSLEGAEPHDPQRLERLLHPTADEREKMAKVLRVLAEDNLRRLSTDWT
jgi:hypothetical protein